MEKKKKIKLVIYNELYHLFIKTLLGKLIKKGKRAKAIAFYNNLKEKIKIETKKEKQVSFIFLLSFLNAMPKVSFKEIRMGSQKKDLPIPIDKRKQVLVFVETLLKFSKRKKGVELNKLIDCIISSYHNKGILIRNKKFKYKKAIDNKMLLNVFMPKKLKWEEKEENIHVSEKINYKIFKDKTSL